MKEGYIKLFRSLSDHPIWNSEKYSRGQAWVDLVMLTNHKDGYIRVRGIRVDVKRGQCGWSITKLAARWRWSRNKVYRFISELKMDQQVEHQNGNVTSLITIINYEKYQCNDTAKHTADGPQTDRKRNTNKNEKNEKKTTVRARARGAKLPPDFSVSEKMKDWFTEQNFQYVDMDHELKVFRDHWVANGTTKKDWVAAWRNWMRKAEGYNAPKYVNQKTINQPAYKYPVCRKCGMAAVNIKPGQECPFCGGDA